MRARGDRGVVLVESAFIAPILFFMMFSILEFGLAFRDYLALANSTRDGARAASVFGKDIYADYDILQEIASASGVIDTENVQRIVIFKASGPNSTVPTACKTGPVDGVCNSYTSDAFGYAQSEFGCRTDRDLDRFWCPTAANGQTGRKTKVSDPPDYVGVWIQVNHVWITGLFGRSLTFTDETVMRIEPTNQ
jgi:hypothetical protein